MILVHCPHCQQLIEIVELNCRIFRCGIFKQTGEQLPPHLPKIDCDRLVDVIYGCGKPFLINESEPYVATICDYI
jgi:hypothetical protein